MKTGTTQSPDFDGFSGPCGQKNAIYTEGHGGHPVPFLLRRTVVGKNFGLVHFVACTNLKQA
jgi:hypothetical protein